MIILLIGYGGVYVFSEFVKISSNDNFIGIIIIFSMLINSMLNPNYKKYVQRTIIGGNSDVQDAIVSSSIGSCPQSTRQNPKFLSNADWEIASAANMPQE
ncbi:MAG: hypothetical protein QXU18_15315 [Thermoplasmatales archaeon]